MQWDDGPNAGFSTADPERLYLPIDPDPGACGARSLLADGVMLTDSDTFEVAGFGYGVFELPQPSDPSAARAAGPSVGPR